MEDAVPVGVRVFFFAVTTGNQLTKKLLKASKTKRQTLDRHDSVAEKDFRRPNAIVKELK